MPDFSRTTLPTPRLLLRPLVAADAPALWRIFSDPLVMRYWSTPAWTDDAEALAFVQRDQQAMACGLYLRLALTWHLPTAHAGSGTHGAAGGAAAASAQAAAAPEVLGLCTLFALDETCRRAELGYALGRAAWGRGLMHEALQALLDFGFSALALNRVEADVDPRNAASLRSLRRLGFQQEGLLRERWIVADEVSDSALFGLLRRDWLALTSAPKAQLSGS